MNNFNKCILDFEIIKNNYHKYFKDIDICINNYNQDISKVNKNINKSINYYKKNINSLKLKYNFFKEQEINKLLCVINFSEFIINFNDLINIDISYWINYKYVIKCLMEEYDEIVSKNIDDLIDNSENKNITKIFLKFINFDNFSIYKPNLNFINTLIYIFDYNKDINLESVRLLYKDNKLENKIRNIYDTINSLCENHNLEFISNSFSNYQTKYNNDNKLLLKEKDDLYNVLNNFIIELQNLNLFDFDISIDNIIENKKKYIDFISEKEKFISNNLKDYENFNNLFLTYSNLKKNLKVYKQEIKKLEYKIIESDNYFKEIDEEKLRKKLIYNKKLNRLKNLKNQKINKDINNNEDIDDYNNNIVLLRKQNNTKDILTKELNNLKNTISIIKNEIEIIKNEMEQSQENQILITKLNDKLHNKQGRLDLLLKEETNKNYELNFIKTNIDIIEKNNELLHKKKIINDNILKKIEDFNNNNKTLIEDINRDYINKINLLGDKYEKELNKLSDKRIEYNLNIKKLENMINEYNKCNNEYNSIYGLLKNNYNKFFYLKFNIKSNVDILIEFESVYKKYNLICEKLDEKNQNNFIKIYFDTCEKDYLHDIKKNINNSNNSNNNNNRFINGFKNVLDFYLKNIYHIYHINYFNSILKSDESDLLYINSLKNIDLDVLNIYNINKIKFFNFLEENDNLLDKYKKIELQNLISKTSQDCKKINEINKSKNEYIKLKSILIKTDLNKISKYLNNINLYLE